MIRKDPKAQSSLFRRRRAGVAARCRCSEMMLNQPCGGMMLAQTRRRVVTSGDRRRPEMGRRPTKRSSADTRLDSSFRARPTLRRRTSRAR